MDIIHSTPQLIQNPKIPFFKNTCVPGLKYLSETALLSLTM